MPEDDLFIPFKILVVDTEDRDRMEAVREMSETGFTVIGEKFGFNGEKAAQGVNPELLVIALEMPRFDGVFLIRKLRKLDEFHQMPIIALAKKMDRRQIKNLKEFNIREILIKPTQPGQLLKAAEKYYKLKVISQIAVELE